MEGPLKIRREAGWEAEQEARSEPARTPQSDASARRMR